MNEVLFHTMIDKVDAHERKIEQLQEKIEQLPDYTETLRSIKSREDEILVGIQKIFFPEKEMRELSATMVTGVALMRQPVKQEIIHHHHVTKAIWIAAALFLIVCLLSTALYVTADKLKLYKANDTKYRYLKLEANPGLNKWLGLIDSLYIVNPKMKDAVIAKEEQNQRNFEIMQQALQMEKEAKELKQKVHRKRK